MALTEAQERWILTPATVRESMRGKSYEEVEEIRRAFSSLNRLRELERDPRFVEQELGDQSWASATRMWFSNLASDSVMR